MKIQSFFILAFVFVFTSWLMACSGSSNKENSSAEKEESSIPSDESSEESGDTSEEEEDQEVNELLSVASGLGHTCALKSDGSVLCWGYGYFGGLGNGEFNYSAKTPVSVVDSSGDKLKEFTQISAGDGYTCGLKSDGSAQCWGAGYLGQLGNGQTDSENTPVTVVDSSGNKVTGLTDISIGAYHTCALKSDTSALCWGQGTTGQLGNGQEESQVNPVAVVDSSGNKVTGLTDISIGAYHTCALKSNGSLLCWGGANQLGNEESGDQATPTSVVDSSGNKLTGFTDISAGYYYTCALKSDGSVMCWGHLESGVEYTPVYVADSSGNKLTGFTEISAGYFHTCGLKSDGSSFCWGTGSDGELGNGQTDDQATPVSVVDSSGNKVSGFTQISGGHSYTCALKGNDSLMCWGMGDFGQLGNGKTDDQYTPVSVDGF